jgi:DNA-binding transcriptional regulator YbjK
MPEAIVQAAGRCIVGRGPAALSTRAVAVKPTRRRWPMPSPTG